MQTFIKNIFLLAIQIFIVACSQTKKPFQRQITIHTHKDFDSTRNAEAREDSVKMALALFANSKFQNIITANAETDPVESFIGEDAADDPAIWVNPRNPEKSLVLGTQKKAGIYVYDLSAKTRQFIAAGHINNVDIRNGFEYNDKVVALVAGSNRSINSISLFVIDTESAIVSDTVANIKSSVDEVYGLCMYKSKTDNSFYIFVNGKGGKIEQWKVWSDSNIIKADLTRSFSVNSQPEGMVTDDKNGMLYLGVEEQGICRINAEPEADTTLNWLNESSESNPAIKYDIEGLAIYHSPAKSYLIVSIQGNFSYAIWEIGKTDNYLTSFVIWESEIDGVEETDGLDVTNIALGKNYPEGLLVVQDGFNYNNDSLVNQNFKFISCEKINKFLK